MLFDRALRLAVRNFSTVFLVVFVVILPLHLVYALFFHDVFAVRELHPAIADFPENRQVRGVGRDAVAHARIWFAMLAAIEVAAIPLFVRAIRRVLVLDQQGFVPDAVTAWRTAGEPAILEELPSGSRVAAAVACVVTGVAIGALVWLTLARISEMVPDAGAAFALAFADAASRSAGAAFGLTGIAVASGRSTRNQRELKL